MKSYSSNGRQISRLQEASMIAMCVYVRTSRDRRDEVIYGSVHEGIKRGMLLDTEQFFVTLPRFERRSCVCISCKISFRIGRMSILFGAIEKVKGILAMCM